MPYISTAEKIGIEKGIEQGIEQGIETGIEKGKIEDAKAMLAEGCDPVFVAKITKLPLEKIKELQNERP